ncbi:MAG: bifunctional UDP-N-acetylglucosamine diphosphorylase/glucosamine-1-phosphate N-acetyltransferase GlmU [Acidobacteriota bacterium]
MKKKTTAGARAGREKSRRKPAARRAREADAAPAVVVLAAGVGSRMRSKIPKVLHRIGGRTLIEAVLDAASSLTPAATVAVLGARRELVEAALAGRGVAVAVQDPPLGTGDAVRQALPALKSHRGPVVVLSGDVPLLRGKTLAALLELRSGGDLDLAFLTFRPPEAGAFGRVVRDGKRRVRGIVEAKNATPAQAKIGEVNAGVYCFSADALARAVGALEKDPASGEFFITDAVAYLAKNGGRVDAIAVDDWREAWGINTRRDLARAEEIQNVRAVDRALDAGATLLDPTTARIGPLVTIEADAVIHPFVCLAGTTVIGSGAEVFPFTRIADSRVEPGAVIGAHCDLEGAVVGRGAHVGPFARLRPGTVLGEDVKIGNFVETKKAVFGRGAKASHLSYLGDAEIGARANVGAGVITCNYDGEKKHRTEIGEGAFIGSDSQLVAPVKIGPGAYVGAGSTVTKDVPAGALALSREPQKNVEGWAGRRKTKTR